MKEDNIQFTKFLLLVNGGVPALLLGWDALHHQLGANPANFAILTTGMLALVFLMLTMLVTPLRKITGWNWLVFSRRTFGLYAFFYASLHFLIFFCLDRGFSVSSTLSEMVKRKYLLVGITGLLAMVPLAITSTNAMIKRLGGKRWRALHRLAYVAAGAGVLHYYMQVKADVRRPLLFAAALALLLGCRLLAWRQRPAAPSPASADPRLKFWSGQLRIGRIIQETPDVRTLQLVAVDGGRRPFEHQPGQYLILSLQIAGKKVNRTYTIASSPARPDGCEVTIKREEMGLASCHLHDSLREGDVLNVSAPAGRFTFNGNGVTSVVLIAGGVGITPVMSMLRHLTDTNWQGDTYFVYCAKTPRDIIFRRELEDLQKRFPRLHLLVTLSRAEGTDWTGRTGRLSAEMLAETIPNLGRQPVYLCGPDSMMKATISLLRELGVPEKQIHLEAFVAAKRAETTLASPDSPPATSPLSPPLPAGDPESRTLTFARSGKSVPLASGKTILEQGEDAGLGLDFECRSGICGRCKARLLAGSVTMEVQDALDEAEKLENVILLCQARSTGSVTIDA